MYRKVFCTLSAIVFFCVFLASFSYGASSQVARAARAQQARSAYEGKVGRCTDPNHTYIPQSHKDSMNTGRQVEQFKSQFPTGPSAPRSESK